MSYSPPPSQDDQYVQAKRADWLMLKLAGIWLDWSEIPLTVIVQDGASSHKSKLLKSHWQSWHDQGLLFFFPPYNL